MRIDLQQIILQGESGVHTVGQSSQQTAGKSESILKSRWQRAQEEELQQLGGAVSDRSRGCWEFSRLSNGCAAAGLCRVIYTRKCDWASNVLLVISAIFDSQSQSEYCVLASLDETSTTNLNALLFLLPFATPGCSGLYSVLIGSERPAMCFVAEVGF